ncbi:MAG TPA: glycosyl transferase, partial [Ornithinimicrobium sp.]|nr:glycosyl transferase [Ornithinimicrobium sp.]
MDVSVVTSGHDLADARLHREVAALLDHGIRVEVLALGHGVDAPAGTTARTWRRRGPVGRAALAAEMAARARGG